MQRHFRSFSSYLSFQMLQNASTFSTVSVICATLDFWHAAGRCERVRKEAFVSERAKPYWLRLRLEVVDFSSLLLNIILSALAKTVSSCDVRVAKNRTETDKFAPDSLSIAGF